MKSHSDRLPKPPYVEDAYRSGFLQPIIQRVVDAQPEAFNRMPGACTEIVLATLTAMCKSMHCTIEDLNTTIAHNVLTHEHDHDEAELALARATMIFWAGKQETKMKAAAADANAAINRAMTRAKKGR